MPLSFERFGQKTGIVKHSVARCIFAFSTLVATLSTDYLTDKTTTIDTIQYLSALSLCVDFVGLFLGNFAAADVYYSRRTIRGNAFKGLRKKVWEMMKTASYFCAFIVVFHVYIVLLGASVLNLVRETFQYSVMMTVFTILPCCFAFGGDINTWLRVTLGDGSKTDWERHLVRTGVGTVAGSWFGAFALPLDWDVPWQVWPVCCVYGALAGHLVVNIYALIVYSLQAPQWLKGKRV